MGRRVYFCLVGLALVGTIRAGPPPPPSAGIIERELEKEYEASPIEPNREVPVIQIDMPEEKLDLPDGKTVMVREIVFSGNDSIDWWDILPHLEEFIDKKLSIKAIYQLCRRVDQVYAERGYFIARAYPPTQEIRDGILHIAVIEGKLGKISVVGNKFYSPQFIQSYFLPLQEKALQEKSFLKALMLLNENSDLMARAVFEKGEEFGTADVILHVEDKRPLHLYLNGNNFGRFLTTNARAGGRFDYGSLLLSGDQLSIAEVIGFPVNALYFTDLVYKVPLGRNGAFLEMAYLFTKYKIEEQLFLRQRGRSDIATLKYTQAILRTRALNLNFFSYFDYKQIQNFVLNHRTSFDKLRVLTAGILLDRIQQGFGRDYLTVQLASGIPNFLGGLSAVDSECSRPGGGGKFFMLNIDYDRIQHLPWNSFFYFHGSAQLSPSKLTVPEQLYIGGVDTVRGYPLAIGLGDSGYYFNCEFRTPPPWLSERKFLGTKKKWKDVFQLDAFLDHGATFLQSEKNLFIWGTGLGIRVSGPGNLSLSVDVGFPLNHRDLTNSAFMYLKLTGQPF